MASIKKKSGGGGGANWMDTYGDMVTLLLCFFVLLYSISTIEQDKWMVFVKSFNRDTVDQMDPITPGATEDEDGKGGTDLPIPDDNNEIDQALKELYDFLVKNIQSSESASSSDSSNEITVSKGDGYVFVSFAEAVFFGPDSSDLRQEGKDVLDKLIPSLRACAPAIDELRVMGHTSQSRDNQPNRVVPDRQIASMRATNVVIYLQERIDDLLDPGRLVPIGYGQWRNTVQNDSEENRVKNRRVEMIITGKDLDSELAGEYEKYETMFTSTGSIDVSG